MSTKLVTTEYLREILSYDPTTGIFMWRKKFNRTFPEGKVAGSKHSAGYISISVFNQKRLAHRLAWLYMTGNWPVEHIDHINGNKQDNRFVNLREVNRFQNLQNITKPTKANKSGFLGVSAHQGKWRMQLMVNRKRIKISGFNTPEEAHQCYVETKSKLVKHT